MDKAEANKFNEMLENFESKKEKLSKEDTIELVELALRAASLNENASNLCVEILEEENNNLKKQLNQQKVVIPKFVAEWIKFCKENAELSVCLMGKYDTGNSAISIGDFDGFSDWIGESDNESLLARAWLDDYEVEKEKLYRVELPTTQWDDDAEELEIIHTYLFYDITSDETHFSHTLKYPKDGTRSELTEQRIKAIDKRYWAFAVEVEDAE